MNTSIALPLQGNIPPVGNFALGGNPSISLATEEIGL